MRIEWDSPVIVDLIEDSTDVDAVSVRQGAKGVVLLIVGKRRAVTLAVEGSAEPVRANPEAQRVRDVIGAVIEEPAVSLPEPARVHAHALPAAEPQPAEPEVRSTRMVPELVPEPVPEPAPELVREPELVPVPELVPEPEPVPPIEAEPAPAADSDDTGPAVLDDDRDDTVAGGSAFDDTILKPSATEVADSAFDDTVISAADTTESAGEDEREAAPAVSAVPGLPPLPADVPPARLNYRIRTAQGQLVALDRPVYIGRAPRSSGLAAGAQPWLVPVPSPTREVSGTHLQIVQEGGTVVVHDLSSNGTIVIPPGQAANLLSVGQSRVVAVGTLLDIGDGNVIEVVDP